MKAQSQAVIQIDPKLVGGQYLWLPPRGIFILLAHFTDTPPPISINMLPMLHPILAAQLKIVSPKCCLVYLNEQ